MTVCVFGCTTERLCVCLCVCVCDSARAQTFSLLPKSYRAECINVPKNKENSDCIEKLMFCILANIGLKIPAARVKSNQAEFFKVFVRCRDTGDLCSVMPTIQKGNFLLIYFHIIIISSGVSN